MFVYVCRPYFRRGNKGTPTLAPVLFGVMFAQATVCHGNKFAVAFCCRASQGELLDSVR